LNDDFLTWIDQLRGNGFSAFPLPLAVNMKKSLFRLPLIYAVFLATAATAAPFSQRCPDLQTCTHIVSKLLNQKYLYDDEEIKGRLAATGNVELTQNNAEFLFTYMLYSNGAARIALAEPNTYRILKIENLPIASLPIIQASHKTAPPLPRNWDLYTLHYQVERPEHVQTLGETILAFTSPRARVVTSEGNRSIFITDAAVNLREIYTVLKGLEETTPISSEGQ
jgi:type II secretory pathway component GspD/PulD (secretin)